MATVSAFEAKTRFGELLERVTREQLLAAPARVR
jgi:hypothetical protein